MSSRSDPSLSHPTSEPGHTPGPIVIAAGRNVVGTYGNMLRIESLEPFCAAGQDYPDGGSTKCYTQVVCGIYGDSPTALANAKRLALCWNSHDALLATAEAALPLLLLAAIKAPDRECAKRYSETCGVLTAAIKAAKGGAL